jgi:hypothetical protein
MENVEARLQTLLDRIHALSDEAWNISETEGRATTPYLNIPCLLADAARACAFAIRIEQEKKEAVDA